MKAAELTLVSRMRAAASEGKAREMRESAKVGLRELAGAVGISPASLSRWETGECRPQPAAALRWAQFLTELTGEQI